MKMDFWERIMIPEGVRIPILGGIWYRLLTKVARKRTNKIKINELSLNTKKRDFILTFTLTSFPARIDAIQHTLKSLFSQSLKPDRVVLWLAEDEFAVKDLPQSIKDFQNIGLEVRFCENLFGHKRHYKIIEEQKENELIVMFDDDIIFPSKVVERLYDMWKKHPKCVVCDRGQVLSFNKDGTVKNPGHWSAISKIGVRSPSYRILPSPGGGCLIPFGALYEDACDVEKIKKYALKTDDIWMMFMMIQNNTKVVRTYRYHRIFILSENDQTVQLGKEAIYQGRYMQSFADLCDAYPHAYKNMISEISE